MMGWAVGGAGLEDSFSFEFFLAGLGGTIPVQQKNVCPLSNCHNFFFLFSLC